MRIVSTAARRESSKAHSEGLPVLRGDILVAAPPAMELTSSILTIVQASGGAASDVVAARAARAARQASSRFLMAADRRCGSGSPIVPHGGGRGLGRRRR